MCGRYASSASNADLLEEFDVALDRTDAPVRSILAAPQDPPAGTADHNIAPSKNVRVVLERPPRPEEGVDGDDEASEEPVRQLRLLTWGLVPSWSKDPSVGSRMFNARAETVLEKPAFRAAGLRRRALVPADGWYEWQRSPTVTVRGKPRRQPFFIHRGDDVPLAFAGLYEFWKDPAGDPADPRTWLASVSIVTTAAEPGLDRVHDRQPLVLEPEDWGRWLDPRVDDRDEIAAMLAFARPGRFEARPVGRAVGSSRVNGPDLRIPAPVEELEGVVDPTTGEIIG
ncbi:SOS response-associated peptidase [Mobilicoccus pelagius]|uniref:Abasic site processing protein n=1 Tax=Mobilicoccus pelagius NBRC 104925 TaxID=1089455 RepID=H5URT0_9MICO|nr:SOS response-associated peptidase [Mobilicoccus pelagius]GAB48438.1 hypothetical protein MOPEL_073_00780 [Mobilicoccus pelagius NBRC 104925]